MFARVQQRVPIEFVQLCLTTAAASAMRRAVPAARVIDLALPLKGPLPKPNREFLASLEGDGVPTVHNMILGDRVLRTLPPDEATAYVALLTERMLATIGSERPDLVLGGFDSVHAGVGLATSRYLKIPWVAMHFTAIPRGLMNFCTGISPATPLPIKRSVDQALRLEARREIQAFLGRTTRPHAYRSADSVAMVLGRLPIHGCTLMGRITDRATGRFNRYNTPTPWSSVQHWARKRRNLLLLGRTPLLRTTPVGRFGFLPLQMQPESSIDAWAPFCSNQFHVVEQVARAMPADMTLAVKLHVSDGDNYSPEQLARLTALPGVAIVHPSVPSRELIERSAIVFGIMGTACLEAALLRKPVVMFGNSPYLAFPGVSRVGRVDELPSLVRSALVAEPPSEDALEDAFMAFISSYMPATLNDWTKPLSDEAIDRYATCFRLLCEHLQCSGASD
ncbi:MAG: hypothetical protein ACOYMI_02685 [Phycisphaerales bacterium]